MSNTISNLIIGALIHALSIIVGIETFSLRWWTFVVVMAVLIQVAIHTSKKRATGGVDAN